MPKPFAHALTVAALLSASAPAIAEPELPARGCPGVDLASFERRIPEQVRRYALDRALLEPFMNLWRSGRRPAMPVAPERVTVYALPEGPYLIGYQHGDCVIAFLSVERARLWQWLRPHLGWSV